jgi:hypothetical protein
LFHSGFLLGLLINPEVKSNMFPRNLGWVSTDYMALYSRRLKSSAVRIVQFVKKNPLRRQTNSALPLPRNMFAASPQRTCIQTRNRHFIRDSNNKDDANLFYTEDFVIKLDIW